MENTLTLIHHTLKDIYTVLSEMKDTPFVSGQQVKRRLLNKLEVMSLLRISDSTYRRYVRKELLNPMTLDGIDMYYEDDLRQALEISRRKGRF